MEVTPPTARWGKLLVARQGATPPAVESVGVALRGGVLGRIRFLRWDLHDFEFADGGLGPGDGWVLTLAVEVGQASTHLWQGGGVFYTARGCDTRHVDASVVAATDCPRWHSRSDRLWPVVGSAPLPFLGQFRTMDYHGYIFGEIADSTVAVLICPRAEQDVEDHYDGE